MSSKKEEVFGENATGINTMFNKCNIKIPNFENESLLYHLPDKLVLSLNKMMVLGGKI